MRAAELEVLFTANTDDVAKAEKDVKSAGNRIENQKTVKKVDADAKPALEGMEQVEKAAQKLVSKEVKVKVDAEVEKAEADAQRLRDKIEYLGTISPAVEVTADIARAEAQLSKVERYADSLRSVQAEIVVTADVSPAEDAFDEASSAASSSGEDAGKNFGVSIVAAIATIPIVGAVVGIGKAAADALVSAFNDGLQQEKSLDRLQGLTGISEQDALRFGRASSEAYANGFGESIAQNMDTTRLALQFKLIDPEATNRDAKQVVEGLAGIADVLSEDVQPVAAAVTALLRTGLAKSAEEAFDLIATGAREGLNQNEDFIDTLTEYPALFQRLGLSGEEALGLINQGLEGGARNSDLAADALKEFQIRATDGSKASAEGFAALGLNAEEMTSKIAAGGAGAKEGLDQVLDGLRAIEDPVARNAAAVALFGTQAEDLGEALFAMDLSNAVDQLNGVTGSAERMFATLASNDASKMEQAQRNIEVAMDGIKGALAAGLSDPIAEAAEFISENRGPMLAFFQDLGNGALDFGDTMIEAAADGTEAFGEFTSGPLADLVEGIAGAIDVLNGFDGRPKELDDLADSMRGFDTSTSDAADRIRSLHSGLDEAREGFNGIADGAVAMGYLNDASLRLAEAVDTVGYAVDGVTPLVDAYTVAQDGSVQAGGALEGQIRASIAALGDEVSAAAATGEAQGALTDRYNTATDALVGQLTQMGLTEAQARSLIDTVLKTPPSATTAFSSNAPEQQGKVQSLADRIVTLPDGSVVVSAQTADAEARIRAVRDLVNSIPTSKSVTVNYSQNGVAYSDSREGRANGGAIYGPGGPRDDLAGVFRLSNGEHVLDAEDVRRMGGQDAVYRFRQMLDRNQLPGFADGGAINTLAIPESTWRVGLSSAPMSSSGRSDSYEAVLSAISRLAAIVAGGRGRDAVYVQNPFTGEYVEARIADITRARQATDDRRAKRLTKRS